MLLSYQSNLKIRIAQGRGGESGFPTKKVIFGVRAPLATAGKA